MQSWIEIVTDPQHIFADFLMNVGFEVLFALITYVVLVRMIVKKGRGRRAKRGIQRFRRK
jgi:hypothetical protein